MQPLRAILLLALAALASAETGNGIQLECPGPDWTIYQDRYEASCLKLMPESKLFQDAFKVCFDSKSRLLSLLHKKHKINFVNNLIIHSGAENNSMWFFDSFDTHNELAKENPQHPRPGPEETRWLVFSPNADESKVELLVNMTAVPRRFICEAPARPAAQRAQLEREPEDAFISEEMIKEVVGKEPANKRPPFVLTFNCQAFGIPKPTVSWVMTVDTDANKPLVVESINATVIYNPRLPPGIENEPGVLFFSLQHDCKAQACPNDNIQERSQLIVLNAHRLDLKKRIACVARNDFGSVLSREAQIYVTKLREFANHTGEIVSVHQGLPIVAKNTISADPDAAALECFRVVKSPAAGPAQLIPLEQVNHITHGGIQLSKATFDFIVDAATPEDAGQFMCHAHVHNGRLGHVTHERTFTLEVKPCPHAELACNLTAKPVSVVPGYPAVLSMNHLSNKIIRDGDDFLLECPCTGKRHPLEELTVTWNLNNRTDLVAVVIPVLPMGSAVLIRRANSRVHTGEYHCNCMRGAEASAWSTVRVAVLPAPSPADHRDLVQVKAGQAATLDCFVPALDPGVTATVQPLRGIKPLAEAVPAAESKRFKVTQTGANKLSLAISGVKETDSDVYGCRVIANYMDKWVDHNTYYTTLLVGKAR